MPEDFNAIVRTSYANDVHPQTQEEIVTRDFNACVHVALAELLAELHTVGIG